MEVCSICLQPMNEEKTITNCNHTFCTPCIDEWFNTGNNCPMCREGITEIIRNQEKTRIIFHQLNRRSQVEENNILLINASRRQINYTRFFNCILWFLLIYACFQNYIKSYTIVSLNNQLFNCQRNLTLSNERSDEFQNELNNIDDLGTITVFERTSSSIILCDFPRYFINKCFGYI
uniref:RING-type domain-containing protein n=1 Tax=viral metagenome TaxID=1070528 RepID=A0A6C0KZD2_9ZZZZ